MAQSQDNTTPEEKERAAAMDADIIALRRQRVPFDEIGRQMAEKYGRIGRKGNADVNDEDKPFSKQYMSDRYREALAAIPAREAAAHRAELGELLNQIVDEAYAIAQKDHLAHSNGRVIEIADTDGKPKPVLDDGPKLAALAEVRKATVELVRLYGLAVPVKQELGVNTSLDIRINGVDLEAMK